MKKPTRSSTVRHEVNENVLALVSIATEPGLLVVLTDIWLVIESSGGSDKCWCSKRTLCSCELISSYLRDILLDIVLIRCLSAIDIGLFIQNSRLIEENVPF